MRVYIAGPMAGLPEYNFPAFHKAEESLSAMGYGVVNPARLDEAEGLAHLKAPHEYGAFRRAAFLHRDFEHLLQCDAIALLPGWEASKGANAELAVARIVNMGVWIIGENLSNVRRGVLVTPDWALLDGHLWGLAHSQPWPGEVVVAPV